MSKKDEALKLALETSEGIVNADWRKWDELASPSEFERWAKSRANFMATILREALAEQHEMTNIERHERNVQKFLAEQTAQQQEPEYAWPTVADYERDVGFQTNEAFRIAWNMARTTNRMLGHTSSQPAQRTWVGLTFAEICECENDYLHIFARAIEAKLKEKNT